MHYACIHIVRIYIYIYIYTCVYTLIDCVLLFMCVMCLFVLYGVMLCYDILCGAPANAWAGLHPAIG